MMGSREKEDILQKNGYRYNFIRMIYFNVATKKIFSSEWVEDNDKNKLVEEINNKGKNEWQFYFSSEIPSEALKKEILKELKI